MVVGRLLSFWEGNFSGAMLNFGGGVGVVVDGAGAGAVRVMFLFLVGGGGQTEGLEEVKNGEDV